MNISGHAREEGNYEAKIGITSALAQRTATRSSTDLRSPNIYPREVE